MLDRTLTRNLRKATLRPSYVTGLRFIMSSASWGETAGCEQISRTCCHEPGPETAPKYDTQTCVGLTQCSAERQVDVAEG